jgi:hypothetical protein
MYGQSYILGVEAWLAAPLFALFGTSATLLKLPLLGVDLAIAWLLLREFERGAGLRPALAGVAALPFLLPPVSLAAMFVEPSGGNVEPLLYVLLIWVTRRRPLVCGAIAAVGFLQREFTIYGVIALLVVEAVSGALADRASRRRLALMLVSAALVWGGVQALRPLSSGSGPGTSIDELYGASNNVLELAQRTCISPATAIAGTRRLFDIHFPELLGTAPYPLTAFSIESRGTQGLTNSSWLPLAAVVIAALTIAAATIRRRAKVPAVAAYLVIVGGLSIAGYVFGRCGQVNFAGMRYELLSVLAMTGLWAWFLSARPPHMVIAAWAAAVALWMAVIFVPHVQLAREYAHDPPVPAKTRLIEALEARGVRYGTADYWLAYYITFMTDERMIFSADAVKRIRTYDRIVAAHPEAIHLSRRRCANGELLIPGVYRCE